MPVTSTNLNPAYLGSRPDVLGLVTPGARRVLDVGCSAGALGKDLKASGPIEVVGVELLPEAAKIAQDVLDEVHVGDVESILASSDLGDQPFDTIIMADVLEHLRDPWSVLNKAASMLSERGEIIVSLPNVRHMSTLFSLIVRGRWPYRDRGIHDRTHLRFFTKKNIEELFAGAGLIIERMEPKYRLIESPHPINWIAKYLAVPGLRGFLAFQYLVRATPVTPGAT